MPSDHPRDRLPTGDRYPATGDRYPARRRGDDTRDRPAPATYQPGDLEFSDSPGREYWWERLDPNARRELLARVGDVLEWYAFRDPDHPDQAYAVVLGERGLAMTRPEPDRGRVANKLLIWSLRESSHRQTRITGAGGGAVGGADAGVDGAGRQGAGPEPAGQASGAGTALDLSPDLRDFLGNLPAAAQRELQRPFVAGDRVRAHDYFYFGDPDRLDIWCCLAGARSVTFITGTGVRRPGRRAYDWDLRCRRAEVDTSA